MRSWPAQKARPAPVRITTRTAGSRPASRNAGQELALERRLEAVERLRPVEGDRRDAIGDLPAQGVEGRRRGHRAPGSAGQRTKLVTDELEEAPVDRLVGAVGVVGHESGQLSAEVGVVRGRGPGDEQMAIGQPDQDRAADRTEGAAR